MSKIAFAQSYLVADSTTSDPINDTIQVNVDEATGTAVDSLDAAASLSRSDFESHSGTLITDSSSVQTDDDVASYIRGTLAADTRISKIDTDSSSVSVSVEDEPAFLMGFVATTIPVTVRADAQGAIMVSHPEHSFLLRPRYDDQLATNAKALVAPHVATGADSNAASLTPRIKAEFISALQTAINETH